MWSIFQWFGRSQMRRREVRKQLAQSSVPLWRRWADTLISWPVVSAIAFAALTCIIALFGKPSLRWVAGSTVDQPILAQVRFTDEDTVRRDQLRQEARAQTPSYYRINRQPVEATASELRSLYEAAKASEDYAAFELRAKEAGWTVDRSAFDELRRMANDRGAQDFADRVERLSSAMLEEYTAEPRAREDRQPASRVDFVRVVIPPADGATDGQETVVDIKALEHLIFTNQRKVLAGQASRLAEMFPFPLRETVTGIVLKGLQSAPLLEFDKARTDEAMLAAENAVPPVVVTYEPGQPIVAPKAGERLVLTENHVRRLRLHEEAYRAFLASNHPDAVGLVRRQLLRDAGLCALLIVLTTLLFAYIRIARPRMLEARTDTLVMAGLLLATFVVIRAVDIRWAQKEFLLAPALASGSILTIAYTGRFAMGAMALASLMMMLMVGGGIDLYVTVILALAVTTALLQEIRTRTRIITTGLLAAGVAALATWAFGLILQQEATFAGERAGLAAGAVLAAALFIQGVLPFIERTFGIATALTLLEWRDASKPLLQRLAREAPGTYAHSLVLSTMAEAACESIGADGLLTGVGALYHDIGKIPKAEYFAENQEASISRHEKLSPTMSLLIIVGHVKDGVEMAKEYGLPPALHAFIEEHHGTTLVKYFHHIAAEKQPKIASGRHDRAVPEAEFRYPGPKPQTRESAILMLCDGVEGMVRSLSEPTAGRIEAVVHQIVTDRLNDGQFDDCDITLREIRTVEESLVKSLVSFYHGRVAYPKSTVRTGRAGEEQRPTHLAKSSAG